MSFQITILENPLTTWSENQTREILNDVVSLKTEGYGRAFNDPLLVIPLDVFEFVGHHILVYYDNKLVMGYKSVSYQSCQRMNLNFPLHQFVSSGGTPEHQKAYSEFFQTKTDKNIHYDCHLTVSNDVAKNPELLYECLSILYSLVYHYRNYHQIDYTFMLGTYFAGTHKTFQKMGAKAFAELGSIYFSVYDKRQALIMLCDRNFSGKCIDLAQKYQGLWQGRKVINANTYDRLRVA